MRFATKTSFTGSPAVAISESPVVMTRFLTLAVIGALADLLTKALATSVLGEGQVVAFTSRLGLMLVYNTGVTGGASLGPLTGLLNMLTTCGAIGNLASMLAGPEGVADFLAVRVARSATVVMNVADLLLWGGAFMLAPVVLTLLRAVRKQRAIAT